MTSEDIMEVALDLAQLTEIPRDSGIHVRSDNTRPILAPIAWALGVDSLQIGVIICGNLVIGLATPPFGIVLFVTSPMTGVTVEETFKGGWPMLVASIGVLLLLTYWPPITLWLPRMFGY